MLQKLFSAFPDGWPGVGLVLLRLAVALSAIAQGLGAITAAREAALVVWAMGPLAIMVGLFVLIGFLTPIACTIAAPGNLFLAVSLFLTADASKHGDAFCSLYLAVISVALVLLGPGAFSLDARLFGRREIIIPDLRRPPR